MERPVNMHPAEIGTLAPQVLHALTETGNDMLEGTLELVDEWVVNQMKEALWSVSNGNFPEASSVTVDDEVADLADHELQEFAAALLTVAAGQPKGLHGMLGVLGTQLAEDAVLRIEDWASRYDTHDITDDEDMDPAV